MKKAFLVPSLLLLPLLLLKEPAFGQSDEEFRTKFMEVFSSGCFAEQRKAPGNARMSDAALQSYCTCFSQQIPAAVTVQEMRQVSATGALTPAIQSKLTAIGKSCIDRLKQ